MIHSLQHETLGEYQRERRGVVNSSLEIRRQVGNLNSALLTTSDAQNDETQ